MMISHTEVVNIVKKAYPSEFPVAGCDIDDTHSVVGMNPSENEKSENTNWRWVDRESGDYGTFNPGADFMAFLQAMNSRRFL